MDCGTAKAVPLSETVFFQNPIWYKLLDAAHLCALLTCDYGFAVHVWDEGLGNYDAAVGLLVIFEDGEPGAADGQAAAVERVDELGLARPSWAVADVGAAGLEGLEVGAGRDFAVEVLAGEPDFEVVGLGGGEAHVAGAEEHAAIGEAECFEDGFGVAVSSSCSS